MAAPKGNTNATRAKEWRDALNYALENFKGCEKGQALRQIATTLIQKAMEGDLMAIREIADRIDGKPVQAIEGEMVHRLNADQLSDSILAGIATGGSDRAAEAASSEADVTPIH